MSLANIIAATRLVLQGTVQTLVVFSAAIGLATLVTPAAEAGHGIWPRHWPTASSGRSERISDFCSTDTPAWSTKDDWRCAPPSRPSARKNRQALLVVGGARGILGPGEW